MTGKQKQLGYPDPYAAPVSRTPSVASSPSSGAAAAAIASRVGKLERLVLDCFLRAAPGGLTDREVQRELGMSGDTERPRRVWLVKNGFVENRNDETRLAAGSKRPAAVWTYTGKRIEA